MFTHHELKTLKTLDPIA
jgi:hypothetical protein